MKNRGVFIIGYEIYKILTSEDYTTSEKERYFISSSLIKPWPQLVVCDE
jgi:hypothetical protein